MTDEEAEPSFQPGLEGPRGRTATEGKGKPSGAIFLFLVNFMYQLVWTMVPRYVVKYDDGCFCENLLDEMSI